ncbi:Amphiphysin [Acipenser ruthenus]|uniref:Amphiphysin n=1 Tax=Acipenser ruthenus TaxID=7906 RepID=A0A444V6C4_ACIRT|nr:Amphiphysin [Acipenser ruthenus]
MAEIKTGVFAKNVQKRISRAQEKVLQKLGKADETKDEQFEQFIQNFKKQEAEGTRLQRELRGYLAAVKAMQEASMKLTESLHEVYEPEWYGADDIMLIGKGCDALWEDFHQRLVDGALITLDTYLGQFPDIKTRIAKRSRKLVDYDSARHHLESLQNAKRKDDGKITKAEEEFNKAQKVFEELNVDLQEELPSLWDSDTGPLRIAKTPSPPDEPSPPGSPEASPNHMLAPASPAPARPKSPTQLRKGPPVPPPPKLTPTKELHQEQILNLFEDNFVPEINVTTPSQNVEPEVGDENKEVTEDTENKQFQEKMTIPSVVIEPASNNEWDDEELQAEDVREPEVVPEPDSKVSDSREMPAAIPEEPAAAAAQESQPLTEPAVETKPEVVTTQSLPPGYLYKAEALHDFEAASSDELDLKKGDLVLVIPTALVEDQEAGWLTGIAENDWLQYRDITHKGLFPENFTQRIE